MKKILILFSISVLLLVIYFMSSINIVEEEDRLLKQEVKEFYFPIEITRVGDYDSILNVVKTSVDSLNLFYKIIYEYDSVSQVLKYIDRYNYREDLFAKECSFIWEKEISKLPKSDSVFCEEFDLYRDWYKINFPNGGIVVDDLFLNLDGSRSVAYYHGAGCACCSEVNIKFKSISFHDYDDPRRIIERHHLTNQVLSGIDSEFLRIDTGAISIDNIVDSINNVNLSIMRLNNSIYDSSKLDVVIVSKETEVYFH